MKRNILIAALALPSIAMAAPPVYHPPGSAMSIGSVSNMHSLVSTSYNPAGSWSVVQDFRFGILSNLGGGYELGQVDNFATDIEDLIDILDKEDLTVEEGTDAAERFNELLPIMEADGYVKAFGSLQVPLMPLVYRHTENGVFSVDFSVSGIARLGLIADEVTLKIPTDPNASPDLDTDASAYVKSAGQTTIGLGYSGKAWSNDQGELIVGARANIYRMSLSKQLISLESLKADDDIGDVAKDQYEDNANASVNAGLDVGVMWLHEHYQLGATIYNLNEPEFEYGVLGDDCLSKEGSAAQSNCFIAQKAATDGKISLTENYVMNAQLTLEGSAQVFNKQLSLSGSYDVFDVNDPLGDRYQNVTVSASYFPNRWWAPGVRLGYRKNLVGSELSSLNLGLSLFKRVNLDFAYGLESIDVDGDAVPRTLALNLGIESAF